MLAEVKSLAPVERNTLIFIFVVAAMAATVCKGTLAYGLVAGGVYALAATVLGRKALRLDRPALVVVVSTGTYALVKVTATLAHSGPGSAYALRGFLFFLLPLFLLSFLRASQPRRILDILVFASGFSALLAMPLAAYQASQMGLRVQTCCGNPGIFGVIVLIFGAIGGLNMAAGSRARHWLGWLSLLAMVFGLLVSGMRGLWIGIPIVAWIVFWAVAPQVRVSVMRRGVMAAIAVISLGVVLAGDTMYGRVALIGEDIERIRQMDDYDSSTGLRLLVYKGAWKAIRKAPITGYGVRERMNVVRSEIPEKFRPFAQFSHPHNGFLAAMLDAGVFGLAALLFLLAAPLWVALTAPRDENWRARLAVAMILTTGYVLSGMTNILFEHDAMDSAFIVLLVLIAASIPETGKPGSAAPPAARNGY